MISNELVLLSGDVIHALNSLATLCRCLWMPVCLRGKERRGGTSITPLYITYASDLQATQCTKLSKLQYVTTTVHYIESARQAFVTCVAATFGTCLPQCRPSLICLKLSSDKSLAGEAAVSSAGTTSGLDSKGQGQGQELDLKFSIKLGERQRCSVDDPLRVRDAAAATPLLKSTSVDLLTQQALNSTWCD